MPFDEHEIRVAVANSNLSKEANKATLDLLEFSKAEADVLTSGTVPGTLWYQVMTGRGPKTLIRCDAGSGHFAAHFDNFGQNDKPFPNSRVIQFRLTLSRLGGFEKLKGRTPQPDFEVARTLAVPGITQKFKAAVLKFQHGTAL